MIELQPGDIFCSGNIAGKDTFLSSAIKKAEKFHSKDNEATYGHAGIILNPEGETLEALWSVKRQNLFNDYAGSKILIGRHVEMDQDRFDMAYEAVKKYEDGWYPGWRLGLFLVYPPLAKYFHFAGMPVCSELAAMFCKQAELTYFNNPWGINPDDLADMIRKWRLFKVVFEGVMGGL